MKVFATAKITRVLFLSEVGQRTEKGSQSKIKVKGATLPHGKPRLIALLCQSRRGRDSFLRYFVSRRLGWRQQFLSAPWPRSKKIVIARAANKRWERELLGTVWAWLQCRHALSYQKAIGSAIIRRSIPCSNRFERLAVLPIH